MVVDTIYLFVELILNRVDSTGATSSIAAAIRVNPYTYMRRLI